MTDFIGFFICAAVIFLAGKKLSYYGDLLAGKTGWGRAWVGLILLSAVTTLPELMAGISSAAIVQSADLAVGNALGSCAFNLGILAMMDAFIPKNKPLFSVASPSHVLAATLGIILLTIVGLGLFLPNEIVLTSWIGATSIAFIIIYLVSVRIIFLHERKKVNTDEPALTPNSEAEKMMTLQQIVLRYLGFAVIIIAAALVLPNFAEGIAASTGLGESFVGTLLLAASTSLPELAISISAIRMGAIDLSVGNLLGSNIFNILILAIDDLVYVNGYLLKDANENNLLSVFSAILMSAIVIIGLTFRSEGKRYKLAWDAALIFLIYLANIFLLYKLNP